MSVGCQTIIEIMEKIAPSYLAESWDNVGLQVGSINDKIDNIMIALDITEDIVNEAVEKKVDLIITHHPLIFKPIKSVTTQDTTGRIIYNLIKNNISFYCCHTNLDKAKEGTNEVLARRIGLKDIKPFLAVEESDFNNYGLGRIGNISSAVELAYFCEDVKKKLNLTNVKLVGKTNRNIKRVGVCSGSGASFIYDAYKNECDCFVTGDVKYHDAQYALGLGMTVIDAGHFETENIICDTLVEQLNTYAIENNFDVNVFSSKLNINPFQII